MARKFIFAQGRPIKRAHVYEGGETVWEFVLRPEWGVFETREAAKRWYCEGSDPDLKGTPDYWIARHFKTMCRNHKIRLVREPAEIASGIVALTNLMV